MKVKKKTYRVRNTLLIILAVVIAITAGFAVYNGNIVTQSVQKSLDTLSQRYEVTEVSAAPYDTVTLYGVLRFNVKQYEVRELGNLCVMTLNAGVMQMMTLVLTPYGKAMPIMSMDFMYVLGYRNVRVECFGPDGGKAGGKYQETAAGISRAFEAYAGLKDFERKSTWYDDLLCAGVFKTGLCTQDGSFLQLPADSLAAYAQTASALPALTEDEKAAQLEATRQYCEEMLTRGGFATNLFKKALGEEKTRDFFEKVFYGTAR